jgi:hypothetical protein
MKSSGEFPASEVCGCTDAPGDFLINEKYLGMDSQYAEISIFTCSHCGRHWLRYFYENEAFTASGRWYLGSITEEQASMVTAENAKAIMEGLSWCYFGGSYYYGHRGRMAGPISLP